MTSSARSSRVPELDSQLSAYSFLKKAGLFRINRWIEKSINNFDTIKNKIHSRTEKAQEILNAGVDLIGKDKPNAWLRAIYFREEPRKRECYIPLHKIHNKFDCPKVDMYEQYIDWISIFV